MSLWRTKAPSKVLVFGWRLVLSRLPTRKNLEREVEFCVVFLVWCLLYVVRRVRIHAIFLEVVRFRRFGGLK